MPVAQAVHGCRLQQVIAGVAEQLGVGPHTVGDILGAELLHAPPYLEGRGIQQLPPGVVLQGG